MRRSVEDDLCLGLLEAEAGRELTLVHKNLETLDYGPAKWRNSSHKRKDLDYFVFVVRIVNKSFLQQQSARK